jgi:biopolymer transport protein ExbB
MKFLEQAVQLFFDGGPVIMSLILLCSLLSVFIIIDRFLYLGKLRINDDRIIRRVMEALKMGRDQEALAICDSFPGPVSNLIRTGLANRSRDKKELEDAIRNTAAMEIPGMERFVTTLGTIATISTLLGLLGTVQGNMEAFGLIGAKSALGSMELLASGIAKALITTAFGLVVSIPATIFYNHLTKKISHLTLILESRANELVYLLTSLSGAENGDSTRNKN